MRPDSHFLTASGRRYMPGALVALPFVIAYGACGCQDRQAGTGAGTGAATSTTTAKKVYAREEFKQLVLDKTFDEVTALLGKPDSMSETAGMVIWYFNHRTKDPVTDKIDARAQLMFQDGKVAFVSY